MDRLPHIRWQLFLALVLWLVMPARTQGAELEPAQFPSLISSIRALEPLEFCGEPASLENPETRERLEKEVLLYIWNRPQVVLWLKRSTRYFPHIEKMLDEADMPADFRYLAVVESALLPYIRSKAGAVGFWLVLMVTWLDVVRVSRTGDEDQIWKAFERDIRTGTRVAVVAFQVILIVEAFV